MVVYRAPGWKVLITSLPDCNPLHQLKLDQVGSLYECQQIRSYKSTAVILFTEKKSEKECNLVTMDIAGAQGNVAKNINETYEK